jgi:hypothetical protein
MVKCLSVFMDLCYLFCRNAITYSDLKRIKYELCQFQQLRDIFIETGVHKSISLPRQHALGHYFTSIVPFGSLNGLCSLITKSKHIKAVKEPWQRSSHFKALSQMVHTVTRLDKLAVLHQIYLQCGMMVGMTAASVMQSMVQPLSGMDTLLESLEVLGGDNGNWVISSISSTERGEVFYGPTDWLGSRDPLTPARYIRDSLFGLDD